MSTASLLSGALFGCVGLGYFVYGKRQQAAVPLICGVVLMALPYFIDSTLALLLVGAVLVAVPYFFRA